MAHFSQDQGSISSFDVEYPLIPHDERNPALGGSSFLLIFVNYGSPGLGVENYASLSAILEASVGHF
jgi:hypothetical protein